MVGLDAEKGPGRLGHGDEADEAEPQNIFHKTPFPFISIDRNSS